MTHKIFLRKSRIRNFVFLVGILVLSLTACRKEERPLDFDKVYVTEGLMRPDGSLPGEVTGFYLLNQGNMGSNKASLDYFDYGGGVYYRNLFAALNPQVSMELGDVGNDLKIWRDRLYAVINCSNLVEVLDVRTGKHLGTFSIPNCRYIAFDGDYGYVSSYAGPVSIDPSARPGKIVKVDLSTLEAVEECTVGYQPDQLAVVSGKLYVANSGGYRAPSYDRRISVLDLTDFKLEGELEVGLNAQLILALPDERLLVGCSGNYQDIPARAYLIHTADGRVEALDYGLSGMSLGKGFIYAYSQDWSGKESPRYFKADASTLKILDHQLIKDGTDKNIKMPYSITVHPETGDFFITDARDYVTPGKLYCYGADGNLRWSVTTGDIPACIAFTYRPVRIE